MFWQIADIEARLPDFVERYLGEQIRRTRETWDPDYAIYLNLLPLSDIHLTPIINFPLGQVSSPVYTYILSEIALAVLIIASVNFMNLSLGLSSTRFREVGMRKVLGATRVHLIHQFWGEALFLCLLALGLSIALVELVLPAFNNLVNRNLSLSYGSMWFLLFGLVMAVGLLSGSYPALAMSGFRPLETLKGRQRIGGGN